MKKKYIFISLILVGAIAFAYSQKDQLLGFVRQDLLSGAGDNNIISSIDTAAEAANAAATAAENALEAKDHAEMMYGTLETEDRADQATALQESIQEDATTAEAAATRAESMADEAAELTEDALADFEDITESTCRIESCGDPVDNGNGTVSQGCVYEYETTDPEYGYCVDALEIEYANGEADSSYPEYYAARVLYEESVTATEEAEASAEEARAYSDEVQEILADALLITVEETPDYGLVLIQVEDAYGNLITDLSEDDVTVSGADDTLYTFETWGDGYLLTLLEDESYTIEIHPDGYESQSFDTVAVSPLSGDGELIQLEYAYTVKVYDGSEYLDSSSVYAGDLSTECEVVYDDSDDPIYACLVPLSETEYDYKVETSGYDDIEGSFDSDRTSDSDSSESVTVSLEDDSSSDAEDVTEDLSDAEKSLDDATDISDTTDDEEEDTSDEEDTTDEDEEDTSDEEEDSTADEEDSTDEEDTSDEESDKDLTSTQSKECAASFTDIVGHWAEDPICLLFQNGIVEGRREGYYVPDDYVTKAEFLKMALLSNSFEVDYDLDVDKYSDVNPGDWYYYYVALADSMKDLWFSGDGTWSPNTDITRGDAILLIVRLSNKTLYGYDESDIPFSDVSASSYQAYAIILGEQYGVIEGYDGTDEFRPDNKITRAEAAIMTIRSSNLFE